jgi:hypothetical protein
VRTFGPEPVGGPVQRAEKSAGRHRGVGGAQDAALDAVGDHRAHAAFVAIALGDDRRAQPRRQRIDLEVRRRALDLVEQAADVGGRHLVQALGQRPRPIAAQVAERLEQPIERAVLAEEQDLVLAAEVMIEIGRRQVRRHRDLAHPGGGKAAGAEDAGGGAHDGDAAAVGPDRTTVRKLNHRSILAFHMAFLAGGSA